MRTGIANRIFLGEPEGKRPLGRPRRRSEGSDELDLRGTGHEGVECIQMNQDRV
jgi:hypothetical protein